MHIKKLNILIIEDSPDDVELYTRHLNKIFSFCDIEHASMAEDGIRLLKIKRYDLVLLDYNLPSMNGVDFMRTINLANNILSFPIIALTGQDNTNIAVEFMRLGVSDYIPKNEISFESMSRSIHNALENFHIKQIEHEKQLELYRFAHTIAHDLKAPLGRIGAYSNLLAKKYKNLECKYIDNIQEDSHYMVEFLDNLLLYAESGRSDIAKTQVDLNLVVEKSIRNLELEIANRDAVIKIGNLPKIYGDNLSLTQLFQNLISNSIKYCQMRPEIEISSETRSGYKLVSLMDNGIGIAKNKIKEAFKPFSRIANDLGRSGLGLGLALCETIAQQHSATIDLMPRKDGGTKANIVFAKI
jgi:signal transduction histidine kinase